MSSEAELYAIPREITYEGTVHPINLLSNKCRLEFERRLVDKEISAAYSRKRNGITTPEECTEEINRIEQNEMEGKYCLYTAWRSIFISAWHTQAMAELLMPSCPKDVLQMLLDTRLDEIIHHMKRSLMESLPKGIVKREADPNV